MVENFLSLIKYGSEVSLGRVVAVQRLRKELGLRVSKLYAKIWFGFEK